MKIEKIPKNQFPKFWMDEISGKMKEIVMKFLEDKNLDSYELQILKDYLIQWIDKTIDNVKYLLSGEQLRKYMEEGVPPNYKDKINNMNQYQIKNYIVKELLDYGIDPFQVIKLSSKRIQCIRSESEDYLATDINNAIKDRSNVLDIQIFDHDTYWIAFIIFEIKHVQVIKNNSLEGN